MLYGVELVQLTETVDVAFNIAPVWIANVTEGAETRQVAWTVALTPKEAIGVAGSAGLESRHNTRRPSKNADDADLTDVALFVTTGKAS
jgi:hypothetical protein